jgi:hypothetical protein
LIVQLGKEWVAVQVPVFKFHTLVG